MIVEKLKKFFNKILNNSWLIAFFSLVWLVLRTGVKPTRVIYPCQQVARANLYVFGLPAVAPFWLRLKRCKKFRLKVASLTLVTLFLLIGAFGFARTKVKLASWFWQFKNKSKKQAQVLAQAKPKVVWVRDNEATDWNFTSGRYYDHVDQTVVDDMVEHGLLTLTETNNLTEAWNQLLSTVPEGQDGYQPGEKIAIKVNFNNSGRNNVIDALIQPVNSLITSLRQAYPNFNNNDVLVYEGKTIPNYFITGCTHSGVQFYYRSTLAFNSSDPSANIVWNDPVGIPEPSAQRIPDLLVDEATYVINMPIIKKHAGTGVTLSFKNHLGSIQTPYKLHEWIFPGLVHLGKYGGTDYSPLVDIYLNSHVGEKTVLVVGDGLYGNWRTNWEDGGLGVPVPWSTFGEDAPNSLFLATDPVAVDSVMFDLLYEENEAQPDYSSPSLDSCDYLVYAETEGLGAEECGGDPWDVNPDLRYSLIDLIRCNNGLCEGVAPTSGPTTTPTSGGPTPTPTSIGDLLDVLAD